MACSAMSGIGLRTGGVFCTVTAGAVTLAPTANPSLGVTVAVQTSPFVSGGRTVRWFARFGWIAPFFVQAIVVPDSG